MRSLAFASIASCALLSAPLAAQARDTAKRAPVVSATDSAIAVVRAIYDAIEGGIKAKAITRHDSTFTCDTGDQLDSSVRWYANSGSAVRRIDVERGSEDHAESLSYYYDDAQRLRFAFAVRGAVTGAKQEERVYYSESGKVIARRTRVLHAPGYPFGPIRPLRNPRDLRKAACG